jgi:beta-glucuronidase
MHRERRAAGAAIIIGMRRRRHLMVLPVMALLASTAVGCLPAATIGTLAPTLIVEDVGGVRIATQNGIPVPDFGWQPRPRISLDGAWRMERATFDTDTTLADRANSLSEIEADAGERQQPAYDDRDWGEIEVPGTINPPPAGEEGGAWLRRSFTLPRLWSGDAVTLRFASASYVADVWLNGTWLGYHEGGGTPFAFDAAEALLPGEENVLAVRIHTIALGTRSDIVPWGIVDWWNYGGLTGSVWLEASPPVHVVRADVIPHLDAVDVNVLLAHATRLVGADPDADDADEPLSGPIRVNASVLPASVTPENVLAPDPRTLVPPEAEPLVEVEQELDVPPPGGVARPTLTVAFRQADTWSPASPALYVLRVTVEPIESDVGDPEPADATDIRMPIEPDAFWITFGIRHVAVDPIRPRVLLNGEPAFFHGVGLHTEALERSPHGTVRSGSPAPPPDRILAELEAAAAVGADLLRTGHQPGHPTTLMLADRLGFAVWEEIPMYHATPLVFDRTMSRGIPQQMLREMALRDMNRPSVLFHGLANESTGGQERADALAELHAIDREIDGTRLTGQAAYGWDPADATHAPLDVAGFTFYHGVFYGEDPGPDTRRALRLAHEAQPDKPIMVLEFGRWADTAIDEARQAVIFEETYRALEQFRADEPTGFVSAATWWTLRDFATQLADIEVEHFGLYRPDGSLRPAGELARVAFEGPGGRGADLALEPELENPRPAPAAEGIGDWALGAYLAYGLAFAIGGMSAVLFVLTRRGGRATGRRARA